MVASGIFGGEKSQHGKNGNAVMVDSMRRFEANEVLQAMSCRCLVNTALGPFQKVFFLVKLGGIQTSLNAMLRHPFNAEVEFRALFRCIPSGYSLCVVPSPLAIYRFRRDTTLSPLFVIPYRRSAVRFT